VTHADPVAVTWGLFSKLEAAETPPDPEVEASLRGRRVRDRCRRAAFGCSIVAALLRKRLIEQAEACGCGFDEWLRSGLLRLADR